MLQAQRQPGKLMWRTDRLDVVDIGRLEGNDGRGRDDEISGQVVPGEAVDRKDVEEVDDDADTSDERRLDRSYGAGDHDRRIGGGDRLRRDSDRFRRKLTRKCGAESTRSRDGRCRGAQHLASV